MQPMIIGTVRSPLKTREQCPKYGDASLPPVWIDLVPEFEGAAAELRVQDAILVFTWMHEADQRVLRCHPKGDPNIPERGVFATRSPDRPTPIGLHPVRIVGRERLRLQVHPLEAMDGTPVIDIKPDTGSTPDHPGFPALINPQTGQAILAAGRDGWLRALFAGFNGNISMRQGSRVIITATGSAKGHLEPQDLAVVELTTGAVVSEAKPSSELGLHLEIYRQQPQAAAIVHTHPPGLLTLALRGAEPLLTLPLFEAQVFARKLARVPALMPGSVELAQAVGQASQKFEAVFMDNHGLVCWGETLLQALGLAEELESLAGIGLGG